MLEIEIKASLAGINRAELLAALEQAGFSAGFIKEETDLYFNGNNRDFRKTDEALRLRTSRIEKDNSLASFLTYKGSKVDSRSQTRPELEISIDDPNTMHTLLEKLGYPIIITLRKHRAYYHNGSITACLDEVEGLGHFLELEQVEPEDADEKTVSTKKEAVIDHLLQLLDSFGVPQGNLLQQSYLELLMTSITS